MKKIEELNKSKLSIVKIDKSLGEYKDKVLFKEKVEKANEILKAVGLSETFQKAKALTSGILRKTLKLREKEIRAKWSEI